MESFKTSTFEIPGRILVVEDEPMLRSSVIQFLERRLHTVLSAETGMAGFELASKEKPDLILLDLGLPDMDGCDLCAKLKSDLILQYIPIIVTTGEHQPAIQLRAFETGANDFLAKPIDFLVLEARVRSMLKYKRAIEALRRAQTELERRVRDRTEELVKANAVLRHEIEERKQAQDALRRQQTEQQIIFNSVPAMIWYKDRENRILRINKSAADTIGLPIAEIEGRPTADFYPEEADKYFADDLEVIRTGQPKLGIVEKHRTRTGEKIWVRADKLPYRDESGRATGVIVLAMDITDRMRVEDAMRESAAQLEKLIENMDALLVHDRSGRILMANQPACEQLEYSRDELLHLTLQQITAQFDPAAFGQLWDKALAADRSILQAGEHRTKSGRIIPVEQRIGLIELGGRTVMMCLARDITERLRQQEALARSEERYALAARGANDGLWDWNIATGRMYFSPRWKAMIGWRENEIDDDPANWFDRVHPDDVVRLKTELEGTADPAKNHVEGEYRLRHRDNSYRWMLCRGVIVRDAAGQAVRMAGSQTDITGRKIAEMRLQHDALHDALTGLPNRVLLLDRTGQAVVRGQRAEHHAYAVLLLGIDRFKIVNDSLGHRLGDQLLIETGRRLERIVRTGDTAARLGGDEFAVLLDGVDTEAAAVAEAERIKFELSKPYRIGQQDLIVTFSVGLGLGAPRVRGSEELLRDADAALHRAKKLGKARLELYRPGMAENAYSVLQLETDLRNAISRNELRLHYQPIVDLENGRLAGFEALVRWARPGTGIVSPGEFIPLAEETELIVPMTWWVLHEACRQLRAWQESLPGAQNCWMSVNLSSKLFNHSGVVHNIQQIINDTGLDPRYLKLEVTESAFLHQLDAAAEVMQELKKLHLKLVLDDFGTGYSSLSYLHNLPIDTLKVDRSFVARMSEGHEEIVRTIVTLANNLSMDVVAEGVETQDQIKRLRELRCQFGQGYVFAKPLNADSAADLVAIRESWL